VPRGKARDLTFGEGYGVRDLAFGPPGWLVARGDDRRRTIYAYDDAGWRKTRDVVATQAWWAADRVVFVSPEGQLGTLMLDGTRYHTPRITLGPDAAKTLDDHPERVHLGADGHHLIYDGGDHVVLLRLADGAELYRSSANGHRGSNYEAIHGAFLTATTAGIAYTANADYEGRLAIINLRTGTATTRSLGRLGSYGGGLAGFDISPSFDWRMRPLLSPRGEFLVLVRDDDALVQVLGARGATKSVARVSMATQL